MAVLQLRIEELERELATRRDCTHGQGDTNTVATLVAAKAYLEGQVKALHQALTTEVSAHW